jgi:hypothetical protein
MKQRVDTMTNETKFLMVIMKDVEAEKKNLEAKMVAMENIPK